MISDEALKTFKKLYLEEFGADITDEQAMELAVNLLTFFNAIYRPVKQSWLNEIAQKENDIQK